LSPVNDFCAVASSLSVLPEFDHGEISIGGFRNYLVMEDLWLQFKFGIRMADRSSEIYGLDVVLGFNLQSFACDLVNSLHYSIHEECEVSMIAA